MDPFEVRIRFTSLLSHLSASHTSHQKAAVFALKNREMDEDLHSCILEQLERNSMNNRANIMFFIDVLCEMAGKEEGGVGGAVGGTGGGGGAMNVGNGYGGVGYVRMMQRDIMRVVDAVCPVDGTGAANVRVVRKVLQSLQAKSILLPETLTELERLIKERDIGAHPFTTTSESTPNANPNTLSQQKKNGSSGRLDKRSVEQRIEEDRERHKRLRESIWAVPGEGDEELDRCWEEASEVGEDDYIGGEEEREERRGVIGGIY